MYDRSTDLWKLVLSLFRRLNKSWHGTKKRKRVMAQFWGAHQRFYRQMLMAGKVCTVMSCSKSLLADLESLAERLYRIAATPAIRAMRTMKRIYELGRRREDKSAGGQGVGAPLVRFTDGRSCCVVPHLSLCLATSMPLRYVAAAAAVHIQSLSSLAADKNRHFYSSNMFPARPLQVPTAARMAHKAIAAGQCLVVGLQATCSLARHWPLTLNTSSHQCIRSSIYMYLYMSHLLQVPTAARIAHEAIAAGQCVVVGLQSTGEANTASALSRAEAGGGNAEGLDDLVSAPKVILENFITNYLPVRGVDMDASQLNHLVVQVRGLAGSFYRVGRSGSVGFGLKVRGRNMELAQL